MKTTILLVLGGVLLFACASPQKAGEKKTSNPVATCNGSFLGLAKDQIDVNLDPETNSYRVLWKRENGTTAELDQVSKIGAAPFQIQCMNSKEAGKFKQAAQGSGGIHSFLKFPKESGVLCYFTDNENAKCWAFNKKKNKMVAAGGWQT